MKIQFLPPAEAEHLKQVVYYESRQPGLGRRYLEEVEATLNYLCEAPHRFRIVRPPDIRRLDLKVFPFAIIFRIHGETILVAAIAHHRMRPDYWYAKR